MVRTKAKGSQGERELLHQFWENNWACVRVAGSGSMSFPSPDLLAGKDGKSFALECKTFKKKYKYLEEKEIAQLKKFAEIFGAEPWLAIRFDRQPWHLLRLADLQKTEKYWTVSLVLAQEKGLKLAEFLHQNQKV